MHILIINSSNRLKGRRISEIDDQLTMDVKGEGRRGTVHGSQLYVVSDGGRLSRRIDEPISKQRLSTLLSATLKAKEEEKKVPIHAIPLPLHPCPLPSFSVPFPLPFPQNDKYQMLFINKFYRNFSYMVITLTLTNHTERKGKYIYNYKRIFIDFR